MFYSNCLGMLAISQNSIACPVFVQSVTECTWSKTFQSYLSKDVEIIRNQWLIKRKRRSLKNYWVDYHQIILEVWGYFVVVKIDLKQQHFAN